MGKKPFLIGISGGSGSGKTFFLKSFLNHFDSKDISLVSQDDYYLPSGDLTHEENVLYNFDVPASFDEELFTADILKIINGETIYKKEYTFNVGEPRMLEIAPAPIIIVEGLLIFHFQKIAELLDMKIFIDADRDIALQRRIKRDLEERNYTFDDVMYKWENHVMPSYKTYLLPHKESADKIIPNSTNIPDELLDITESISQELKKNVLGIAS